MEITQKPEWMMRPQSHVFVGCAVPTEGENVALTNGAPGDGREVGEMVSAPKVKKLGSVQEVKVVNHASPIDYYIDSPGAELTITVNRMTAQNLSLAMRNASHDVATDTSALIGIGNATTLSSQSVLVTFETAAGSGEWGYVMLYDAQMTAEVEVELAPDSAIGFQLTFKALAVDGRSAEYALGEWNIPASFIES